MSHPITLWDHKRRTRQTTDDAGTTIFKSIIPSGLPIPGPYEAQTTETEPGVFVPSLVSLAIKKLSEYPDQIHALGHIRLRTRLRHRTAHTTFFANSYQTMNQMLQTSTFRGWTHVFGPLWYKSSLISRIHSGHIAFLCRTSMSRYCSVSPQHPISPLSQSSIYPAAESSQTTRFWNLNSYPVYVHSMRARHR